MTTSAAPTKPFANATHHAGCMWWTDLTTPDVAGAKRFYGELLGWTFDDSLVDDDGNVLYSMAKLGGFDACAISTQHGDRAGMPPMWTSYVTVEDAGNATARAAELGATVIAEPFDVLDIGRMSVILDPSGASIALWQTKAHPGAQVVSQPSAYCWSELIARGDRAAIETFWMELMGWTKFDTSMGESGTYTTFLHDGHPAAGLLSMPDGISEAVGSAWMTYFAVADIEATKTRIEELGGAIHVGPQVAPGVGTFVMANDPQGGHFYAMQLDEWPEAD